MYTNTEEHGGNFIDILDDNFKFATSISIATGYASYSVIESYFDDFVTNARLGGKSRLLLGMAFSEGLNPKAREVAQKLNSELLAFKNGSGVYLSRYRFHGKIYSFEHKEMSNVFVGSSNFSVSGTKSNIECMVPLLIDSEKKKVSNFLDDLFSGGKPALSVTIDKINVRSKTEALIGFSDQEKWDQLKKYDPKEKLEEIQRNDYPKVIIDLKRTAIMPKSSLNVFFGKGRERTDKSKQTTITPRKWYEIEIVCIRSFVDSNEAYPIGEFTAYTDDGYIIPMNTNGDNSKNLRSKNDLIIFGRWLKGKLEKKGVLEKYEPVTVDTLEEYGNDKLVLYKLKEGEYYMSF